MKKKILITIPILILTVLIARLIFVFFNQKAEFDYHHNIPQTIKLFSTEFEQHGLIPLECTGKGADLSPSLYWEKYTFRN